MPLVTLIFPVPVKLYKGVCIGSFENTHLFKCSLQLRREFLSQNFVFPTSRLGRTCWQQWCMYGAELCACIHMGDDPAEVSRECRRLNIHTNTLLKMHFHPAEWVPTSNGAHSGHPSLVSSQMCALRLPYSEKQNDVMGNAQGSLFKSTFLSSAKIPVELGFSNEVKD